MTLPSLVVQAMSQTIFQTEQGLKYKAEQSNENGE